MMEQEKIYTILQDTNNQNPQEILKKLKSEEDLMKNIIENFSCHYKKQASHPIYSTLFQLYRSNNKEARRFVLQFVPSIIWIYLSAITRRDKQGYGKLEAIFLAIYNTEAEKNDQQNPKSFRLPSLSRSSIYHESSVDVMSQSALTESALSRHEFTETIIPGPKRQFNRITASNRMLVLYIALNQYNRSIAFMNKASHNSYWLMAYRIAISGFSNLCTPESGASGVSEFISNEEQAKLTNHPRIPLCTEIIQEMMHGLYYLMYNGFCVQAAKAVENLHYRAAHSLLAPAHVLTNAVHHSLSTSGGLPLDGPLGLQVQLSDSRPVTASTALATIGINVTPQQHQYICNSNHNNEFEQVDSGMHQGQITKTFLQTSCNGDSKIPSHSPKPEYELQTLPFHGGSKEYTSEQNIDSKTTAKFDVASNEVYSTKL